MSTRKFIEERRRKKQRQNTLLIIMMVGGLALVVAAVVLAYISSNNVNIPLRKVNIPNFSTIEEFDFNGLGDPNAPVIIEEFSDFGCSYCADFALETKKLIEEAYIETGQVYMVFHSVGALLNAPATFQAAEAAYCAGDQDAFWPFHDLIFANQARLFNNRSADISRTMETFAEILELDVDVFNTCLEDGKYQSMVADDESLTRGYEISGTPTFLINGNFYYGNQPFETLQVAIETALAASD